MIHVLTTAASWRLAPSCPSRPPRSRRRRRSERPRRDAGGDLARPRARRLGTRADPGGRLARADGRRRAQPLQHLVLEQRRLVRGSARAEPRFAPPKIAAPAGPVSLEGGTNLIVLARMIDGQVERLRSLSDDCPIDAGGRTVTWLTGVTPPTACATSRGSAARERAARPARRLATRRVGDRLHRDLAADAILDRLAASDGQRHAAAGGSSLGRCAARTASPRSSAPRDRARSRSTRGSFVSALAQTRQPGTADALLALARNDPDPKVRAEPSTAIRCARAGRRQRDARHHGQGPRRPGQEARGLRPRRLPTTPAPDADRPRAPKAKPPSVRKPSRRSASPRTRAPSRTSPDLR